MLTGIKSKIYSLQSIWVGLAITVIQILTLLLFSPETTSLRAKFLSLNNWDSTHYVDLVNNGYHMPPLDRPIMPDDIHQFRANLGYFPAYHFAARATKNALGISAELALLLTAQVFSLLFWIYSFLLLKRTGASISRVTQILFFIAIYPSAFYMVIGYSESIFMATLVGFIYWSDRWVEKRGKINWLVATLHGLAMASTRIVGIPVVLYPIVRNLVQKFDENDKQFKLSQISLAAICMAGFSLMGPALFFVFCQTEFLDWSWYFKLQKIGWGKDPYYLAIFDPRSYVPRFFFEHTLTSINRAAVPFTAWFFWQTIRTDFFKGQLSRVGMYFTAFVMFYVALSAKADTDMDSMIRYTLPVFALLLMAQVQCRPTQERESTSKELYLAEGKTIRVILGCLFALAIQCWFIFRFLRGRWVA